VTAPGRRRQSRHPWLKAKQIPELKLFITYISREHQNYRENAYQNYREKMHIKHVLDLQYKRLFSRILNFADFLVKTQLQVLNLWIE
jgi:predicted methyltransferase